MNQLFRSEVTAARSQQALGAIRLAQPLSARFVVAVALSVAIALIVFVVLGEYTKKAKVAGVVMPRGGSISMSTTSSGVLTRILVGEGDRVTAGQVLFEVSNERQNGFGEISALVTQQLVTRRESLQTELRLRSQQASEKRDALLQRLANVEKELQQLAQELSILQGRHLLARETVARFQALQSSGYVSQAQVQQKEEDLLDVGARLSVIERNSIQLHASRLSIEAELKALSSNLATEKAQLQRAISGVDQEFAENANRKHSLVTASQDGVVGTISGQVGQVVSVGQTIVTLLPSEQLGAAKGEIAKNGANFEVQLYVPSRTAGFVAAGQTVLIRYAAFPYQKFGLQKGTVTSVSSTPLAPNELPTSLATTILSNAQQSVLGFNGNEALYRIRVELEKQVVEVYGKNEVLKTGMTLEADIVQDKRKIWEWILDPLIASIQHLN